MIITHNLAHTFIVLMQFKLDLCSEYKTQHTFLHFIPLAMCWTNHPAEHDDVYTYTLNGDVYSIHIVMLVATLKL